MSILIKNGRIVTAAETYIADVYIEGEEIYNLTPEDEREITIATLRPMVRTCIIAHLKSLIKNEGFLVYHQLNAQNTQYIQTDYHLTLGKVACVVLFIRKFLLETELCKPFFTVWRDDKRYCITRTGEETFTSQEIY